MSDRLTASLRALLTGTEDVALLWGFRPLRVILLPDTSGLSWSAGMILEATKPPFARYAFPTEGTPLAPGIWIYTPCEPLTEEEQEELVSLFIAEEKRLGLPPLEVSCPTYRMWVLEGPEALFPASVLEVYTAERVLAEVKLRADTLVRELLAEQGEPVVWARAEFQRFQRLDAALLQTVRVATCGARLLPTHRELHAFRESYVEALQQRALGTRKLGSVVPPPPSVPASVPPPSTPQSQRTSRLLWGLVLAWVLLTLLVTGWLYTQPRSR